MKSQHIFLVGPMGAGKTTIGKHLAGLLGLSFIDVDSEIETRAGADIQWIFDMEGEAGFRERESKVLADLVADKQPKVIATGGGIVLSGDNRGILQASGLVVYLSATFEQLVERTKRDKTRPLLQVDDREAVIKQLIETRSPLYNQVADLVFPSGSTQPLKLAKKLAEAVSSL
ncbi:Shikimate kinase 1 [Gammaproteobacteria bacterium MOLA455]|nr:Shikimate kinase 1 [Gammaproteobacteria bacterium MOLA455]